MLHLARAAQADGAAQTAFGSVGVLGWRRQRAQRRSFHGVAPGKGVQAHQCVVGCALKECVEVDLLDPSAAFEAHGVDGFLHGGHGLVPTVACADRRPFVTMASCWTRSRISLTSIVWALWLMNATMARMVVMPRTTAMATDRFGMMGSPPSSSGDRTERSTTTQKVKGRPRGP